MPVYRYLKIMHKRNVIIQYLTKNSVIAASAPQSPRAKRIILGIAGRARNDKQGVLYSHWHSNISLDQKALDFACLGDFILLSFDDFMIERRHLIPLGGGFRFSAMVGQIKPVLHDFSEIPA